MSDYRPHYNRSVYDKLRFKFDGADTIDRNYSGSDQDMFVLSMLNGKRGGTFIEIGANHAVNLNNTYLLERQFQWGGISIDIDPASSVSFMESGRKATHKCHDALTLDYQQLFTLHEMPTQMDYLQIDIEPAVNTLTCLTRIPLHLYRFAVITFETDYYVETLDRDYVRSESRRILRSHGYELIAGDVCANTGNPYEDWWVDPLVVDPELITLFKQSNHCNMLGKSISMYDDSEI